ncbi:hypothetical protein MASR1M12_13000 [Erysipelotrichia bacterium]
MVSESNCGHAKAPGSVNNGFYRRSTVEQTVVAMYMQMNEIGVKHGG